MIDLFQASDTARRPKVRAAVVAALWLCLGGWGGASPTLPVLTLAEARQSTLAHLPALIQAEGAAAAAKARTWQALAPYYPQITGSSGYSSGQTTTFNNTTEQLVAGATSHQYSASLSLTQTIVDFGRRKGTLTQRQLSEAASVLDVETARQAALLAVDKAFYGVLAAQRLEQVSREAVDQFRLHLDQAEAFYHVGTRARVDVTKAKVDLATADLALLKAENGTVVSKVTLANAMGIPELPPCTLEDVGSDFAFAMARETALKTAQDHRPDLAASELRTKVAETAVGTAQAGRNPLVSGSASYGFTAQGLPRGDQFWNYGVNISLPIYDGSLVTAQVAEAKASLTQAAAAADGVRLTVGLQVDQALANLATAKAEVASSAAGLENAKENLALSQARYEVGVGSPLEFADARTALTQAETAVAQAVYDYQVAVTSLLNATGTLEGMSP